jgi:CRP/FNR family cyclic AMP-dependent transcriptional regulator
MIELMPLEHQFRDRIGELIQRESGGIRTLRLARHLHVYNSGERNSIVYYIESGKVKLLLPTPEGKECLLSIRTAGDIFGELCLSGQVIRVETAIVMQDATLRLIPHRSFIGKLQAESLLEGLVQYLAVRISEQHEIIGTMATSNSEQRLAKTLLNMGRRMGTSASGRTVIDHRISHEELSEMVGTTRPRIGVFLKKFRELGLIQIGAGRLIIIEEEKLQGYIRLSALGDRADATLSGVTDRDKPCGLDSEIPDASM